jgi:16S rRNA G527 N7-methylase RsmG
VAGRLALGDVERVRQRAEDLRESDPHQSPTLLGRAVDAMSDGSAQGRGN